MGLWIPLWLPELALGCLADLKLVLALTEGKTGRTAKWEVGKNPRVCNEQEEKASRV